MTDAPDDHLERFRSAPRGGEAPPRRVRCLNPFRWLEVGDAGEVTPCCSPWFKGNLGNINEQSMQEIWNGERYRALRAAMYEGGDWGRFCNADTCPQIKNDKWVPVDHITPETPDSLPITASMLDDVREARTGMTEGPAQIGVACDPRCNLKCIMCSTLTNPRRDGSALRATIDGIKSFLPSVRRLKMMGDGEVFAVPESRDFLFNFDSAANPDTSFLIHTNGILLTPKLWQRIEHLRLDWMVVSMDAATPETYAKIRVGGKWDVLMQNLDFLLEKHRAGVIRELHINLCVMKSNHHELVAFAELGKRLGVTSAYFMPILGDYAEEQIFGRRDVDALVAIARQLEHPALNQPGIDTNAIDEWRGYRPDLRDRQIQLRQRLKRTLPPTVVTGLKKLGA
jgi:MoaA/NifB/PqqE/SkfB family radical SAM enzyme